MSSAGDKKEDSSKRIQENEVVISTEELTNTGTEEITTEASTAQDTSNIQNGDVEPGKDTTSIGIGILPISSDGADAALDFDREKMAGEDRFDSIEAEFVQTLQELGEEPQLQRFKSEYEKLHRTMMKSRENEKKLVSKCKDLSTELTVTAGKVQTAMKLSQQDRTTITNLQKEIEKAWKMVETSNEKESRSKEAIQQLKMEISNLQKIMESGTGLSTEQERSVNELAQIKEELTKERDSQLAQIVTMRNDISDLMQRIRVLEAEKAESEHEIHTLKDLIATKKSEADREQRVKEKLEKELKENRLIIEAKNAEVRGKQEMVNKTKDENTKLEAQIKEQKAALEKTQKDQEVLTARSLKLQQDFEEQIMATTSMLAENQQKSQELKTKDEEVSKIREEVKNVNKVKESLSRKIKVLDDQKNEAEAARDSLKNTNDLYEREIELLKKQSESDKKNLEDLIRERDILNRNLVKASNGTQKQVHLVKVNEQTIRNLENEIQSYKEEAAKQRKLIFQLEKERDKYISEAADVQKQHVEALEDVKMKELQIFDIKKKIAESELKLKQQQSLYEAVRSDRNLYSKNLIEAQDEITEMKRKLKIMNHQIEQLKQEISAKEAALVKEHFEHLKVDKERESLKNELNKLKQQNEMAQQYIQNQQTEEQKLRHIISEADSERVQQKKEYDAVIQERDILGVQLIRRNDELALLYEKIKIQQSTLNKGEIQYRERLEDIRVLKLEIKKLRREKTLLQSETVNVDGLRQEIYRLQRDLLRERTRVKVLEEELENPMNIHRWRKLEGSDPAAYEMIQKIQTLQKRLISKTEEVVEKELVIQSKEKLYLELKNILARQPGPEVAEQLNIYQQQLKDKTRQLKAMASELNMYQAQVNEYKFEIDRVNREIQELKRKYFEQKKMQQISLRQELEASSQGGKIQPMITPAEHGKFVGAGFQMNTPKNNEAVENLA